MGEFMYVKEEHLKQRKNQMQRTWGDNMPGSMFEAKVSVEKDRDW